MQEGSYRAMAIENASQRCGNRGVKWNLILLRAIVLATKMLRNFMIHSSKKDSGMSISPECIAGIK